jgi:acetyltransferase-like isoleucine patch superfamily enzyme
MELGKVVRRFLVPSVVVTAIYAFKYGCLISPRAEVELSPLLKVGKGTQVGSFTKIKASDGPMDIGHSSSIGNNCFITADFGGVSIGEYAMIASNVSIIGANYRYDDLEKPICQQEKTSKGIQIGRNVWIGAGTVVLDGSVIGDGVIVAPNSVVTGKLPDNVIAQGDPATVVFERR